MKTILFICCCLLSAAFLHGQAIFIPGDYASIQEGIAAANPGDTIIVMEGTYYERLNFMGKKPLVLASMYLLDKDESHISKTIIDGSQLPYPYNKSVVYFIMGEDTTSTLCGFTIRYGQGTIIEKDGRTILTGGGIFISGSGARIINNHITHNQLDINWLGVNADVMTGAGIAVESIKDNENWVIIENNIIDHNTCASAKVEASGGGLSIWCNARIANNTIVHNSCAGYNNSLASGGGLICASDPAWKNPVTAVVENNIIAGNLVQTEVNKATYAGAYLQHAVCLVHGNSFLNNTVTSASYSGETGGLGIQTPIIGTTVSDNIFSRNSSNRWCGALSIKTSLGGPKDFTLVVEKNYFTNNHAINGGGVVIYNVSVCMQNNVFRGNHAESHGGAIIAKKEYDLASYYMLVLVNNSFYQNSAIYGGALYSARSKVNIVNTIFSENSARMGSEIFAPYLRDTVRISFSDIDFEKIFGNYIDKGWNVSGDPNFDDHNLLTLSPNSPCIDKGTPFYTCNHGHKHFCPDYDIDDIHRPSNFVNDIGAHEFINDRMSPKVTEVTPSMWYRVYPNPVADRATFEYELENSGPVNVTVYDNTGRMVARVVDESQSAGRHLVQWNSEALSPGVYIYRMTFGDQRPAVSGKIVKY